MYVYEKELCISSQKSGVSLLEHLRRGVESQLSENELAVRFTVTQSGTDGYSCELGTLAGKNELPVSPKSIFELRRRSCESYRNFGVAMIIPTGVDCEVGGDSGDAGPAARLLAACCDTLVLHPNVVNASDINELPANALYVEGSVLTRLLMGTVGLLPVRANRVLLVIDDHSDKSIAASYINTFSAARTTLGMNGSGVVMLNPTFTMRTSFAKSGRASGCIENLQTFFQTIAKYRAEFDAVAIASVMETPGGRAFVKQYYETEMVNPWGGLEALLTHSVSTGLDMPSAHAPMIEEQAIHNLGIGVVDPRKAAEAISWTDLYCILKGLHRSPKIVVDPEIQKHPDVFKVEDIACLVQPISCLGLPTIAAIEQGITVIAVRGNSNLMKNDLSKLPFRRDRYIEVENYCEAAGVLSALRAGIDPGSVCRPVLPTRIWR